MSYLCQKCKNWLLNRGKYNRKAFIAPVPYEEIVIIMISKGSTVLLFGTVLLSVLLRGHYSFPQEGHLRCPNSVFDTCVLFTFSLKPLILWFEEKSFH